MVDRADRKVSLAPSRAPRHLDGVMRLSPTKLPRRRLAGLLLWSAGVTHLLALLA
jgi:hypothetical protein